MSTLTMASHTLTMARDLLMPSQRPMQRLTLLSSTAITDILTLMVMDTDMLDSHTLTTHTPTMERDADAEPEAKADADPYLLYGGYYRPYAYHAGYYPYSYGYPYAYGLWGKK